MVRFAMRFVRDRSTAEEIVQDAWLDFLDALDRFEGRSTVRTFLLAIVANKARTRAVRDQRTVPLSALAAGAPVDKAALDVDRLLATDRGHRPAWPAAPPSTELGVLARETREQIRRAIDELPARQRSVILLHDVHGLSSAESQRVLKLTEGNHRVLLHRARRRVRKVLRPYLDDSAGG